MLDLATVVERNAARRPGHPAVVTAAQSLTYSELLKRAADESGAFAGSRQAVTCRDAVTVAVALVASAMAGGAVLMVDPAAPPAEADRARARFGCGAEDGGLPSGLGLTTSGVTGEPRCVVRPWEAVADNAAAFAEALELTSDDVVMTTSSMHHSYAVSAGLCAALTAGASFVAPGGLMTPKALAQRIDAYSVSVLLSVPMLYRWYTVGVPADRPPRLCVSAGEPVDEEFRKAWDAAVGWPLAEHYGTSELGQLTLAAAGDAGFGRPVRGVKMRVVPRAADETVPDETVPDETVPDETVPDESVPGESVGTVEICVAGPPAVILEIAGGRITSRPLTGWQATGDIGTADRSGRIRIDGRLGDVVNIGGKKVALREVEAALRSLPGASDGAVIAHAGPGGVPKLYAFVVAGTDFSGSDAVTLLRQKLAPHKVPRYVQPLDRLPRTGSGKIRRHELERLIPGVPRDVSVPFAGPGAGESQPTWGARMIRRSIDWLGGEAHYFNDPNVLDIPDGVTLDRVASAVGTLVSRHQALRAFFRPAGGDVVMRVESTGTFRMSLFESPEGADPGEWAARLAGELALPLFTATELPLRCAVVQAGGVPRFLLLILSHQSIDAWAVDIIKSELRQLWAGGEDALGPAPWQLLDQADDEKFGQSHRRGAAAIGYWQAFYATADPSMFDAERRVPEPYQVQSVLMTSPCTLAAVESIARRLRMSTAAVLAGLVAVVLGLVTAHDRITLLLIAANRFDERRRQVVAPMVQDVLCQVCLVDDVDAVIRDAAASTLTAYSYACYDPAAELRVRHEAELRRGVRFDFHGVILNDVRPRGRWRADAVAGDLEELRTMTTFEPGGRWRRQNTTCFVRVLPSPDTCRMELMADTQYLSVGDMREVLAAIESLAVAAASGPVPMEEVSAVCQVPRLRRGPGWVRHRNGWVDVARLTALIRGLPMCTAAAVVADGEAALTAYVCLDGTPDVASLHRAVVAAMRADGGVTVAPDRYVVCAAPPADADMPQAWSTCDVLVTADGRPG